MLGDYGVLVKAASSATRGEWSEVGCGGGVVEVSLNIRQRLNIFVFTAIATNLYMVFGSLYQLLL